MSGPNFVHLHLHTDYSLLDGLGKIGDYMDRANEFGMGAVALTDHGALYGAVNFYEAARKAGVKPIIGCCLPGQLIHTDHGVKPIESLLVGDMVLTHLGRFRPVIRTMCREYDGTIYGVSSKGSNTVWLTNEHPILTFARGESEPTWVRADELVGGRASRKNGVDTWRQYAAVPRLTDGASPRTINLLEHLATWGYEDRDGVIVRPKRFNKWDREIVTTTPSSVTLGPSMALLIGAYLAEGSVSYDQRARPTGVRWTFGDHPKERKIGKMLTDYLEETFGYVVSRYERVGRGNFEIACNNVVFARWIEGFCGVGCDTKVVPPCIYSLDQESSWAFLEGLACDAKVDAVSGRMYLEMTNREVVHAARIVGAKLGMLGKVRDDPPCMTPLGNEARPTYSLSLSPRPSYRRHLTSQRYLMPPIESVAQRQYAGPVYNIEVEEDNSYVTDITLHNCEMYVAPRTIAHREQEDRAGYHLVLLAKNEAGYKNLLKLASVAGTAGFYYKPRIDRDLMREHSEGLVCLSACLAGEVSRLILKGDHEAAERAALDHLKIFGEGNYYLELQDHPAIREQAIVNEQLRAIAARRGIPLVCTADVHYVRREDAKIQDVLICVQTGQRVNDPNRALKMESDTNYFRSPEEMARIFAADPEAVANTGRIAAMCELEVRTGQWVFPDFPVAPGETAETALRTLATEGLARRFRGAPPRPYLERLDYELGVIDQKGYAAYFLIVQDFANWSADQGIATTTRGSAAGCLVSYAIGITAIDPLRYGLPFERFLNPYRPSPPDIDMDFEDARRGEVIEYVKAKYGADRVAQIITFNTLEAKSALRDVGRTLGLTFAETDELSRLVPTGMSLREAVEKVPDLAGRRRDHRSGPVIETALRLEGVRRSAGTHAAGIVITPGPLSDYVPVQRPIARKDDSGKKVAGDADGLLVQWDMRVAETVGLMKMDFLGLANLTVLGRASKILAQRGIVIDPATLPTDDPATYDLLGSGQTTGVFQVESEGMRRYLREMKPTTLLDIMAMIALYRPGPMGNIPTYIARKWGREPVEYLHPSLEPLLADTFGVLVFQDQMLLIAIEVAGYDWGKVDKLRKAVGKKIPVELEEQHAGFVTGCQSHGGLDIDTAEKLWEWIAPFGAYGFNRAHAAAYAQVTYQTAYLKANHPVEYMAAFLSAADGDTPEIAKGAIEARRLGVPILPPSLNRSGVDFAIEEMLDEETGERLRGIRFGLGAIKGVGWPTAQAIVAARDNQPGGRFASLGQLCSSVDARHARSNVLEALIRAGALDELGSRRPLLAALPAALAGGKRQTRAIQVGQATLFGPGKGVEVLVPPPPFEAVDADGLAEMLVGERATTGLYLSGHPLMGAIPPGGAIMVADITRDLIDQRVAVLGMVASQRRIMTKKSEKLMAFVELEDLSGTLAVTVFPRTLAETILHWVDDALLVVRGRIEEREDRLQMICDEVVPYLPPLPTLRLRLDTGGGYTETIRRGEALLDLLDRYPGQRPVAIEVLAPSGPRIFRPRAGGVDLTEGLARLLDEHLGPGGRSLDGEEIAPPVEALAAD